MFLKLSKKILIASFCLIIAACGSVPVQQNTALEQSSKIQIVGKSLVGLTLTLGDGFSYTFSDKDLKNYPTKIATIKRGEDQKNQIVEVKVNTGEQKASLSRGGSEVASKTFYVSSGTTYEWKVK